MADVFLSIGSNQGVRVTNIQRALELLSGLDGIEVESVSSLYDSEPVGVSEQPDYLNCVVKIKTSLDPHGLLKAVKGVENSLGRKSGTHLQPRPIDIDILLYDRMALDSLDLLIPHSRLKSRRFVLEPLLEIAPDITDPVSNTPLRSYLAEVNSQRLDKVMNSDQVWHGKRKTEQE